MKYEDISSTKDYIAYLREERNLATESIRREARHLKYLEHYLKKPIIHTERGTEIIQAVKTAAINRKTAYNGGQMDDGAGYRRRLAQTAVCFFRWAISEAIIYRNPYPKNTFPQAPPPQLKILTLEQLEALLAYKSSGYQSIRDQAIIRVLRDTGLRVSELVKITLPDLDFAERTITVFMSKVRRYKVVPFTETTRQVLDFYLRSRGDETHYLFPGRDGSAITDKAVRMRFRKISEALGFRVHPHLLRHHAGTEIFKKGGQIAAMALLGHIDTKATSRYVHLTPQDLRTWQEQEAKIN